MSKNSGILIVHLRNEVSEDIIRRDLLRIFSLQPDQLVRIDDSDASTLVPYHIFTRQAGFRTTVELYVGTAPDRIPRTDLELAKLLSGLYHQDVLIPPSDNDNDPFAWDLVSPDGNLRRVREIPATDADGVVIID